MADFLTYPAQERSHLGWDPCPGSPEGCRTLAAALDGASADAGELAALIDGLRLDTGGWSGASAESYERGVRALPGHLELTAEGFAAAAEVLRSWAAALETLQQRVSDLDGELGHAIGVLASARGVTLPSGYDTTLVEQATREVARVEALAEDLNVEYLTAARAHGERLSLLGNDVWGTSAWQRAAAAVDDLGDWLEDSPVGQAARAHSGALAFVADGAGLVADAFGTAAAVAAIVPLAQGAAPGLAGASRVAEGLSVAATVGLALGGHGRWVDVARAALPGDVALGRFWRNARAGAPPPLEPSSARRDARDDTLDAGESAGQELLWRSLRADGDAAGWELDEAAVAQRWPDTKPWHLPDGVAYLEAEPPPADR